MNIKGMEPYLHHTFSNNTNQNDKYIHKIISVSVNNSYAEYTIQRIVQVH